MGTFREPIKIANLDRPRKVIQLQAIVDTGATYSWIPEDILRNIGIKARETRLLKIASGKVIKRKIGIASFTVRNKVTPTWVLFGDKGSDPLLGAITLEELGLTVDPIHRSLVPATAYLLSLFD